MKRYLALLRGINVGGHRKVKMVELKALFEDLGCQEVQTYLQSGNVVFTASGKPESLATTIQKSIHSKWEFDVSVLVFSSEAFQELADSNPLLGRDNIDTSFLHITFLFEALSKPILESKIPTSENEEAIFRTGRYYLYCPNGYGKTKIGNPYFERTLKMATTTRNWKTVTALSQMLETQ